MKKEKSIAISLGAAAVLLIILAVFTSCSKNGDGKNNPDSSGISGSITVISREDGSGTRDAFSELMDIVDENGHDAITQSAEITNSTSVMMSTVAGNKKSIGYVSLGSLSDTVKAVEIDGVYPSAETVKSGAYKLQRPFNIAYIDGSVSQTAQDFMRFIMSSQGQAIIEEEGYIGVEPQGEYSSSGISGTVTLAGSTSVAPVMNILADKYKEINPNVKIEIQESGSSAGIESAIQGAVDIAMSSRELKDDELKVLKEQSIALDGIAVIVNRNNSFNGFTSAQIKSIFSGEITAWDEVK